MSIDYLLNQIKNVRVSQKQVTRKIRDLVNEYKRGEIYIPDYQRNFVWDKSVQSRFIESIFMNIPIPPIFFLEKYNEETGEVKYEVIDGVQRLSTIMAFANDKLKLSSGLKLADLERMNYGKLPSPISSLFLNREVTTLIIERNTQPEIQFEIFERLNRGSVSLTHQELRNCMYHGDFNQFLLSLNKYEIYRYLLSDFSQFKEATEGETSKNRMLDVELILRFFTLYESFCETGKYVSPRKDQLNFYMRIKKERENLTLKEEFESSYSKSNDELETLFKKNCTLISKVFNDKAFRRFNVTKSDSKFISFNKAVFDIQMLGFLDYSIEELEDKLEVIYNEFLNISSFNDIFIDSINKSTDHKINERIDIWKNLLADIVTNQDYYQNKLTLKKNLFYKKSECSICNKQIKDFDDAYLYKDESDSNFISHRYCYLNLINKEKHLKSKKKNNLLKFRWLENIYELEHNKALELVVTDIFSHIKNNYKENFDYQLERLKSFDLIGTYEELKNKTTIDSDKCRTFKPVKFSINGENLFIETSFNKDETLDLIEELTSCFSLTEKFILL